MKRKRERERKKIQTKEIIVMFNHLLLYLSPRCRPFCLVPDGEQWSRRAEAKFQHPIANAASKGERGNER